MKLADSNVWLALSLSEHEHHARAAAWFSERTVADGIGFCRSTQLALLRLLTTRAVLSLYGNPPLTNKQAWELYDALVADPRVSFLSEPKDLDVLWKQLATSPSSSPKLWMDAYLAAFAIAGQHQLVTIDTAFTQFPNLDLVMLSS